MNARGTENLNIFNQNANVQAFAFMTSKAEGTTDYGYYTLVGNTKIASLAWHPNILVSRYNSTAAGLYQFLIATWRGLANKLGLMDFSADSQNAAFVELLREKNALTAVINGDVENGVYLARKVWASFPGAGYGQGERTMAQMKRWFQEGFGSSLPSANNPNAEISPATLVIGGIILFLLLD